MDKKEQLEYLEGQLKTALRNKLATMVQEKTFMSISMSGIRGKELEMVSGKLGEITKTLEAIDTTIRTIKGMMKDIKDDNLKLE